MENKNGLFLLLILLSNAASTAFQGKLFDLVIPVLDTTQSLDEFLFAAVNLLDSPTHQGRPFPLLPSTSSSTLSNKQKNNGQLLYIMYHMISPPTSIYVDEEITTRENYQFDYEAQPISKTISLTSKEQELFQIIRQVRDKYCPNTTIRIAGGWVRDKLLQRTASSDIDFVLNNISGIEFARYFHKYLMEIHKNDENSLSSYGQKKLTNKAFTSLKEYGVGKSRHLQTASISYDEFELDFCQLRIEKYNDGNSRVPDKTGIASAIEDAWRRDLTVNSLYFNINTNQVEDWTEQGLIDLQLRSIATPKASLPTLVEDPLRALRAIRFAAQLSFTMNKSLKKATLHPRVRYNLYKKVSKDRIGKEIDGIFCTNDPVRGVALLLETRLVDVVFPLEDNPLLKDNDPANIYKSGFHLLSRAQAMASKIFNDTTSKWDESKRRFLWYASFLKPFVDATPLPNHQQVNKRMRREGSILYQLLTRGLKRPADEVQAIESIINGANVLHTYLSSLEDTTEITSFLKLEIDFHTLSKDDPYWKQIADLRWETYKVLKQIGPLWKEALILMLAATTSEESSIVDVVQRYEEYLIFITNRLSLDDTIFDSTKYFKPILNGSQIQQLALPNIHNGPSFKRIMEAQEEWFVRNMNGCYSDSQNNNNNNNNNEAELINYLVCTFPEYT